MPRAAGSDPFYRLRLMRGSTPDLDEGIDLTSVTKALGVISKAEALVPWAWREGLKGVAGLVPEWARTGALSGLDDPVYVEAALKEQGKAPWQQMERGGTRGQNVHAAFEDLVATAHLAKDYPPEEHGYIAALLGWWQDTHPDVVECERFVACYEGFWGGTLDYVRRLMDMPAYILGDLKTSKGAYPEHHLQVEAYRHALLCPVGKRSVPDYNIVGTEITVLHGDGTYEVVPGDGEFKGFLAALDLYRTLSAYSARHPRGR